MRSFVLSRARATNYPGQFHELREMIGEEKTAILVQYIGGVRLYIPSNLHSKHALAVWLGEDVAKKYAPNLAACRSKFPGWKHCGVLTVMRRLSPIWRRVCRKGAPHSNTA